MFISFLSYLNAGIFLTIAGFHYYWALGGKYGFSAALPEVEQSGKKAFMPGKLATAVVASLFLGVAFLFSGWLLIPAPISCYAIWAIAGITLVRSIGDFNYVGFFKKKSATVFARSDSRYFSPLCLYLALSSAAIAISR